MLDLNLACFTSNLMFDRREPVPEKLLEFQMDDSGTSNSSSVVNVDRCSNAGDEEYSTHCRDVCAYDFDILKTKGGCNEWEESENRGVMTKQFFPAVPQQQWLDLTVKDGNYGVPAEEMVPVPVPVKTQQVKRTRRGPRSRSSQYRGVTFYRRTGRWESHIWFVIILLMYISTCLFDI